MKYRAVDDCVSCVKHLDRELLMSAKHALAKLLRVRLSMQDHDTVWTKHAVLVNAGLRRTGCDEEKVRGKA